ncbi:MAG: TetR family transcriptional regulator [Herbaspirillum sp.]|jgi:AcrR family transcriptional regulator|nr:TetR family transcriptional regulator [Herbaspirillum sp.]
MKLEPRKEPRQARSKAMVDTILDATARVLIERGYAKTNTNAVAETAGISVGSLYQYFPNKNALVIALQERHVGKMLNLYREVTSNMPPDGTLAGECQALIDALVHAHLLEPELNRILEEEVPGFHMANDSELKLKFFEQTKLLLTRHRNELTIADLDLAAFVVVRIFKVLIKAVVLPVPAGVDASKLQAEILPAVLGYLRQSGRSGS